MADTFIIVFREWDGKGMWDKGGKEIKIRKGHRKGRNRLSGEDTQETIPCSISTDSFH
jgi:hypothetical protein